MASIQSPGGLGNVGNTCGINAIVQCVAHVPSLYKALMAAQPRAVGTNQLSLAAELQEIVRIIHSGTSVAPGRFISAFRERLSALGIQPGEQMDASELWMLLMNKVGEEIHASGGSVRPGSMVLPPAFNSGSPEVNAHLNAKMHAAWTAQTRGATCPWTDAVHSMLVHQTQCMSCKRTYHNFETTCMIPLSLEAGGQPLKLQSWLSPEAVPMGEWQCDHCSEKTSAERTVRFWRMSDVIVFVLKRFSLQNGQWVKNSVPVSIPWSLQFPSDFEIHPARPGNAARFDLKAVGNHFGNLYGGHYTALCKNADAWFHLDDTTISKLTPEAYPHAFESNEMAYFVVYERQAAPSL